jgi:hypothetical protein
MCTAVKGWLWGCELRERWERKIGQTHLAIGVMALTTIICCELLDALFLHEKY